MRRSPSTCSLYVSFRWYLFGYGFSRLYADYLLTDWLTVQPVYIRYGYWAAIRGESHLFGPSSLSNVTELCWPIFAIWWPAAACLNHNFNLARVFFFFSVLGILSSSQWRSLAWLNFVSANLFAKLHWFMTICLARFVFAFVFVLFRALPFYW